METVLMPRAYRAPTQIASPGDSPHEQSQAVSSGEKPHCLIIVSFGANTPYLTNIIDYKCRWKYTTLVRYHLNAAEKEFASRPAPRFVLHDGHVASQYRTTDRLAVKKELDQLCSRHEIPFFDYLKFEDKAGLLVKKEAFESSLEKFLREEGLVR